MKIEKFKIEELFQISGRLLQSTRMMVIQDGYKTEFEAYLGIKAVKEEGIFIIEKVYKKTLVKD